MYIPLDIKKEISASEDLREALIKANHAIIVKNGVRNVDIQEQVVSLSEANNIVSRFSDSQYARVGTSRSVPFPPHFSLKFNSINEAVLSELLTIDSTDECIANSALLLIQFAFFDNPSLNTLIIPFCLSNELSDPDVNIVIDEDNMRTYVKRKNA